MVSSAPNSPGGMARPRQEAGANLLQELEALSQALYKASQAPNLGTTVGSAQQQPPGAHHQRRDSLPGRHSSDTYPKHLLSPGSTPPSNPVAGRKVRHSISAKPSLPLYEEHEQEVEWKTSRPVRHSIAAPRAFDAEEAPVPRVERKLQPWHSQGFEQNLPEVTNFPAWLEDNINFSKKLEVAPEKKSIWNWKPFRTLSHIGHTRHNCLFTVHVHAIEGLPSAMNGLRLTVHWRHKDRIAQTMPSRVFQGSAEFEETLQLRCSVYGHKSAHHAIKYMPKAFSLCVIALDVDELNLGEHRLDLSRLLPEAPDSEHEDEDKPLSWTTSFKLSGKAKGGTLVVTFGYEIILKDKHDRSGRFGSVLGSPSPSMPSPSLRSFNGFPHSAHGTPRPRTSDANQYLSPTLSEPGDYHDYMAMEHLNLDESSHHHHEPPRSSVSNLADQRYKLFGRSEFSGKPPRGLYPSEPKTRSFSFAGGEYAMAPTAPPKQQRPELDGPVKVPSTDASAGIPSYGSSDEEDDQEFIVVDQGVEVGHLPDSIIHHHSSSSQSRFGREASDSQGTTPEHPIGIGTPERSPGEKSVTRELHMHMQVSSPPVSIYESSRSVSRSSSASSGELRRGNSEVVITPPVHVPTVVQHFESVISQQPQLESASADDSTIVLPAAGQSLHKVVLSDFEGEEKAKKDEPEIEDYGRSNRSEVAAEEHQGSIYESTGVSGKETVTVIRQVAGSRQQGPSEQDREEDKLAWESFGGEDVEQIAVTVGSPREERAGVRMRQPSEYDRQGDSEPEPEHRHYLTSSATHEEIRESTAFEMQHEIEMLRNVNASEEDHDIPQTGSSLSHSNPPPPPPPIDDLDDEVDLIAGEFLHMLEEGDPGLGGAPLGLSSDSENDSPRALLLKQFEQEALLEGGIGLRMGVPEIPELSLDAIEDSRQYESGVQSDEYSHGGWQSEEEFELASIMEAAESELQKATQTMRSKTRAKMLEDAETEALMQEWGLNEQAFQNSPPKPAQGFLDVMNSQMSTRVPLEPPPLAQGIGSALQTKDGGMLRSVNPVLLGQGGNASGRLMMQVSKPVVVPSEMGSTGLDIFRRMASGGLDAMALQAMMAMPLEDITGKSVHQIAYESTQASIEGSSHGQNYLTSSGYNSQISSYEGFEAGRHSRRSRSGGLTSTNRRGSGGLSDTSDEFVNLEELAPMAMQKIEALAMDGLKIQADMTDETAPYSVDALPYDMGVAEPSGRFQKGGLGSLDGVAAMHLLAARELGEDASTTATDGLMSKVISIDEWMRLDAGMIDEDDAKDDTLAILAAHGAVNKDLVTRGRREDRIRYLQGAKASANFGKGGFMGNMLTIAMLVQLRDPLRNNEPVGAPMMALVQAERVIVPPRLKIPRRQPSILGNAERRWDDEEEEEAESEAPKQPQFKITAVHMSGLKPSEDSHSKVPDNKKKAWGSQKQQQSGSRWLLANGMGKSSAGAKHPALKSKPQASKTTVKPGESLWSISARVHGTGSKWKEVAALNPHIRNPDVIFANQKIRTR